MAIELMLENGIGEDESMKRLHVPEELRDMVHRSIEFFGHNIEED